MNLRLRLRTLWDDLQSSLWFRPAAAGIAAIILAILLTTIDQTTLLTPPVYLRMSTESARVLLAAISGAMLAVIGLIFSILMVALVLASQQFSPRILHNFIRDQNSQDVLSIFIGCFTYTLFVLARTGEFGGQDFTPTLSVVGAFLFSMVAIGAFILFIDHITKNIQVSHIIASINRQTEELFAELFRDAAKANAQGNGAKGNGADVFDEMTSKAISQFEQPLGQSDGTTAFFAHRSGFIQAIDYEGLVDLAENYLLYIKVMPMVGDFIARDRPLMTILPRQKLSPELIANLHGAFDIGTERTIQDDLRFGIRQLVDIALKAISPAINDPTTAVNCIDYLTNILILAACHADLPELYPDKQGEIRVFVPSPGFVMLLDLAFDQLRQYSRMEVTITLRMLDALAEIAELIGEAGRIAGSATEDKGLHAFLEKGGPGKGFAVPEAKERLAAIWRHAGMISRNVDLNIGEPLEREMINERLRSIAARCRRTFDEVALSVEMNLPL